MVVFEGNRPEINEHILDSYRNLIEKCWSQEPEDRYSFDEIVDELKNNKNFITDNIDESEFIKYIDYLDAFQSSFDSSNQLIHFSDFVNVQELCTLKQIDESNESENENKESNDNDASQFQSINKTKEEEEINPINIKESVDSLSSNENIIPQKIKEIDTNQIKIVEEENIHHTDPNNISTKYLNLLFPLIEYNKLNAKCKALVYEATDSSDKQFIVGKSLIEGENDFQKIVQLGLQYIRKSCQNNNLESIIYYIRLLINGKIIPQDYDQAEIYIDKIKKANDPRVFVLLGKISRKKKKFKKALKYFKEGMKIGNLECGYYYAKMAF